MIVVDQNSQVTDWLKSLNIDCSGITRIDPVTFELAQGFEGELVIVEDVCYLQMDKVVKEKLNQIEAVILFRGSEAPIDSYVSKIVSIINKKTPKLLIENKIQFLESQIRSKAVLKSQMMSLNHELIDILGNLDIQLKKVKKVYEEKTPKRLENFKGISAMSKYAAGEDVGGEFFDLYAVEGKVFILMSSCSSFLASSSLLQFFSEMKMTKSISRALEIEFISKIAEEVQRINLSKSKPVKVELLTGIFDLNTLKFDGHRFGDFQLISSKLKDFESLDNRNLKTPEVSEFQITLDRGERILFNSPGFQKNWNAVKPEFLMEELVLNNKLKALDILDEIYFNLKKKSLNGFLSFDASSIILEVDQNVMVQM